MKKLRAKPRLNADNDLPALVERMEKALEMWAELMASHGVWEDACFYYFNRSHSELQEPLLLTEEALWDVKALRAKQRKQDRKLAKEASSAMTADIYGGADD